MACSLLNLLDFAPKKYAVAAICASLSAQAFVVIGIDVTHRLPCRWHAPKGTEHPDDGKISFHKRKARAFVRRSTGFGVEIVQENLTVALL
jgi:hypothetical protein